MRGWKDVVRRHNKRMDLPDRSRHSCSVGHRSGARQVMRNPLDLKTFRMMGVGWSRIAHLKGRDALGSR